MKNSKHEWTKQQIKFVQSKYEQGLTRFEITREFNRRFDLQRTPDSIKHCLDVYCTNVLQDIPKVLFIDIETKPARAYVWKQYDNNIDLSMLIEDGCMLSFCAKWAGDPETKAIYKDMRGKEKNLQNTKAMVKILWNLMDEADIVIWQNGNAFDKGHINNEFIKHKMGPPSSYKTIDTLLVSRQNFNFFSNKLAFLTKKLKAEREKDAHREFPGFELWKECMKGNVKAWNAMKTYNTIDVIALELVLIEFLPFIKNRQSIRVQRVYDSLKGKRNDKKRN